MIAGVILAAGRGERFGGAKLLAMLPSGKTILETSIRAMTAALPSVTVVVRADAALLALATQVCASSGAKLVVNDNADEGMASSIVCAVAANADANGWLIGLADMPYIETVTIKLIAAQLDAASALVVPTFKGQRGHPVGFGRDYLNELRELKGDSGARAILHRHAQQVRLLAVDDAGIVHDIDTPADLNAS